MVNFNISLTAELPVSITFCIRDNAGNAANVSGLTWNAHLRRRGEKTQLLRTEHGANKGEIVAHFPALVAGPADWELWCSSDDYQTLFAGGAVTIFPAMTEPHSKTGAGRSFNVITNDTGDAWQVQAIPGSAARVLLDDISRNYVDLMKKKRLQVTALPPIEEADPSAVYFLNEQAWVPVQDKWVHLENVYNVAKGGEPGLLICENPSDTGITGAPVRISADAQQHEVAAALPGNPAESGVVALSDDFVSHDNKDGLRVRRASAGNSKPGLVRVVGTDQENLAAADVEVYSATKLTDRVKEVSSQYASADKMNVDFSNAPENFDVVVGSGAEWRVWKSNWIECFGSRYANASGTYTEQLPFEMESEDYTIILHTPDHIKQPYIREVKTTEFSIFMTQKGRWCFYLRGKIKNYVPEVPSVPQPPEEEEYPTTPTPPPGGTDN